MFIEHIAIWCIDLENMKAFYCKWFNASANSKYFNPVKKFSSYFLSFENGPRLELMQMPGIFDNANDILKQYTGLIHFAVSAGSAEEVNRLTEVMRTNGITVLGEPRFTGDGYYESVVADPEGNRIEITI
ncbi:VOC family protein [soil metagenome]